MSYIDAVLKSALSQEGVREVGEPNWGPQVRAYINALGHDFPLYWCAAFARWALLQAAKATGFAMAPYTGDGKRWPDLLVPAVPILNRLSPQAFGSCSNLGAYAADNGIGFDLPERGDLFLVPKPGGFRHTGLVVGVSGDHVLTIEGNTNEDGSANGYEVTRRQRRIGSGMRFVRYAAEMAAGGVPPAVGAGYRLVLAGQPLGVLPLYQGRSFFGVRAWAKALGVPYRFDPEEQLAYLGNRALETDLVPFATELMAPIRDLVRSAGLGLTVDDATRCVLVTRP